MNEILAPMAAFLAALGAIATVVCSRAAWRGWQNDTPGAQVGLIAIAAVSLAICLQQLRSAAAFETGAWSGVELWPVVGIVYRVLFAGGMLAFGWVATRRQCGHRGWLAMAGAGMVAWLASWAF